MYNAATNQRKGVRCVCEVAQNTLRNDGVNAPQR